MYITVSPVGTDVLVLDFSGLVVNYGYLLLDSNVFVLEIPYSFPLSRGFVVY